MGCAHKENQYGFTLVEISIVMIIIGLLIGGTFGGMKLIENMQVNKTVQDLKAIESAALTFKDTYGRLPGDIRNPSVRLPSCTDAPCATGGDGNRVFDGNQWWAAITPTSEKFTFWAHLQAADLISIGTKNTLDMNFGEGQPELPIDGGIRMSMYNGTWSVPNTYVFSGAVAFVTLLSSAMFDGSSYTVNCGKIGAVDRKIDDGVAYNGMVAGWACTTAVSLASPYVDNLRGVLIYDLKGI